jgi:hypothetical protein
MLWPGYREVTKVLRDDYSEYPGEYICSECGEKSNVREVDFGVLDYRDYRYATVCCNSECFEDIE